MDVGLWDAWSAWWAGTLDPQAELWGLSILWWGRIGKIVSLLAALVIVAEIIGPGRLRSFGESASTQFLAGRALRDIERWWRDFLGLQGGRGGASPPPENGSDESTKTENVYVLVYVSIALFAPILAYRLGWSGLTIAAVVVWGLSIGALIAVPVTIALVFVAVLFFLVIDRLVLTPVAWTLDRETPDTWIKVGSVLLLLVGFHFDLLSE